MTEYRLDGRKKSKRRKIIIWLVVLLVILALGVWGWLWLKRLLHPRTVLKQSAAVTATVTYTPQTKTYQEPDFSISIPSAWQPQPRPPGPYQTYTWTTSNKGTDGEQIQVFENTIPPNFAVNRELIVTGQNDHLILEGQASDNCSNFTRGGPTIPSQPAALAKWQGISFYCDVGNTERDVIGTSSTDGINTVILKTKAGVPHKFFFTLTNQNLNPDYTLFYNALQSLKMN